MSSETAVWTSPSEGESAGAHTRAPVRKSVPLAVVRGAAFVVVAALLVSLPLLVTDYVLSAILVPVLALALAGIGQNLITGYAGQLSVGSAAFMSVGAFATYDASLHVRGLPLLVSFAFGGLVAGLVGLFFGLPSLRIRGFYLVVSTLAAQFFVVWLFTKVGWFSDYSASGVITAPKLAVAGFDLSSPGGHYWLSLLVVAPLTAAGPAISSRSRARAKRGWPCATWKSPPPWWAFARDAPSCSPSRIGSRPIAGSPGALWAFAYLGTVEPHGLGSRPVVSGSVHRHPRGDGQHRGAVPRRGVRGPLFPSLLDQLGACAAVGGSVDPGLLQNVEKIIFGALVVLLLIKQPAGLARLLHIAWVRLSRWRRASAPDPYIAYIVL
jgi:branched-chain amino acid transport system permease protein